MGMHIKRETKGNMEKRTKQNKSYHNKKINLEKYHARGVFLEMP
jgi:hypothetical protein